MDVSCTLDLGLITDLWAQTDRQTDGQTDEPRGNSAMTRSMKLNASHAKNCPKIKTYN